MIVVGPGNNMPENVAAPGSSEYAAWRHAVRSVLPEAPSDLPDVGTGIAFVARIAAELGHRVTGVDLPLQDPTERSEGLFERHYTSETRAALPAMQLRSHEPLRRMAERAGFVDLTTSPLEAARGWETSPGSDLPYALVGHRPTSWVREDGRP